MILLLNSPPKFTETIFLNTVAYKGTRLNEKVILDVTLPEIRDKMAVARAH